MVLRPALEKTQILITHQKQTIDWTKKGQLETRGFCAYFWEVDQPLCDRCARFWAGKKL